jgi:ribosomal protection tetracycline resistance protein
MFAGVVGVRERTVAHHKITGIDVFADGTTVPRSALVAGEIGKVSGLADVRIGDAIGVARTDTDHYFAPPTLETVVVPCSASDSGPLHAALAELAEQDPLINLRQDDVRHELFVSLYGEVQKEVIRDTLAAEYGIRVTFRETTTICVERPLGTGVAAEFQRTAGNPFLATVGLRIEPAAENSGVIYRRDRDVLGRMPVAFFKAVENTVHRTLREGLYGWQVRDCIVTMTHAGYSPRQSAMHQRFNKSMSSTGYDFRGLTPLVVMSALKDAGTIVCEPVHRFQLQAPTELLGSIMSALGRLHAIPITQTVRSEEVTVDGEIPAAHVHDLRLEVRAITRGEGVLECAFDRYQPVSGPPPVRSRTDDNPLNRKEYLLHVTRKV